MNFSFQNFEFLETMEGSSSRDVEGLGLINKKSHRHKRSFAISGDFDFLKTSQPLVSLPVQYTGSVPNVVFNTTPVQRTKFFMSEGSKHSSKHSRIPNAIIDLDDISKAESYMSKSHRRTESAPADLRFLFKLESRSSLRLSEEIVMEEELSDEDEFNCNQIREHSDLISPRIFQRNEYTNSSEYLSTPKLTTFNNTLKINKQKERYSNYTMNLSSSQHTLHLQNHLSTSSVSSTSTTSDSLTLSRNLSTPNTPASLTFKSMTKSAFNFESKVYDISSIFMDIDDSIVNIHPTSQSIPNDYPKLKSCTNILSFEDTEERILNANLSKKEQVLGEKTTQSFISNSSTIYKHHASNNTIVGNIKLKGKIRHKFKIFKNCLDLLLKYKKKKCGNTLSD